MPEELLESELFGHAKGAFSGAVVDRAGLFEEADGGTLLLDEVADLSPRAQAKLLRALQQQEIRRVGESFTRKVDVRIVAAANRDMRAEAAAGRFRQDLLYRLDVIRIQIPPLRDRPDDIPLLAEHGWKAATARTGSRARLSPATLIGAHAVSVARKRPRAAQCDRLACCCGSAERLGAAGIAAVHHQHGDHGVGGAAFGCTSAI